MVDPVRRLTVDDEPALTALLEQAPVVNLFLRGFLAAHPVDRGWWYGVGRVRAAVLVVPARVAVPFAPDPSDAAQLGRHLREQHATTLLVGPRAACDALYRAWAPAVPPTRVHDQRLYVLAGEPAGPITEPEGFRVARPEDAPLVSVEAARMELEDLGTDPRRDAARHEEAVRERIRSGRTFVIERRGELVFQVNVGTQHPDGCQLGGTWVPPEHRRGGLATLGVEATCRRLLRSAPRVTLHVNESNTGAVRVYEKVGFTRDEAFRLLVP
jgi:predicted GNAT family acetyltransferase